jgi:MtrB/PioB family decaheme-associated outer membrane protein
MSSLPTALYAIDLETIRKIFDAGLSWKLSRRWSYEVLYQHQSKQGTRPFGAGLLTINASHLPAPVDFSTDRLEMGLNFSGEKSHWRLGFSGSAFNNTLESFTWENPFTPQSGTELLRASLAPDNSFYQFDAAGAWAPTTRLRLSASAAVGRMDQDELLLPYSISPNFGDIPLPRLTTEGRIDVGTVNLGGKLTARLTPRLVFTAHLRRDERDNETPVDLWTPVTTDFVERDPRPNRPYSFERDRASLTLRYRPLSRLRLQAGGEWDNYARTLQSVMETEEGGWFAEASFSPSSFMELRARVEQSHRHGEPYLQVPDYSLPDHPLMRKFNLADRDRDQLRIDIDIYPVPEFMVNLAYRDNRDEYKQSIIGLLESKEKSLSLDVNWTPHESVTVYAFASHDDIDSTQFGAETASSAPWLATSDDDFLTGGLGLTWRLSPRTDFGFDFIIANADGDISTGPDGGPLAFPTLVTELQNIRLRLEHRATEHWGIKLYLENERYDSSDWALDGYAPDSIPAVLTFGADSPDYDVTVVRVQASYRF